ncbi:GNAT family N-acetyltransferase [Brachybacterium phenoliresistens]|uniref:GNAT family N-acetyltransferase n=1 Tax=Brachybacterium phenoliresistens TaxID=396014 RepID=UPI0031D3B37D
MIPGQDPRAPDGDPAAAPRLRPATLADVEQIAAAELVLFPDEAWTPWQLAEEIAHPSRRYVVALAGDERTIIGYAGIMIAGDAADLHTIGTTRPGRGIGRALLAWCEAQALAGGAQRMLLEVREDNTRARRVYEEAGYTAIDRRRGYYRIGPRRIDAIVMERALAP